MRSKRFASLVLGLVTSSTLAVSAAPLVELSGRIALADGTVPTGTRVKLGVDLNRDNEISSFEALTGTVNASGSYSVAYELDPTDVDLEFISFAASLVADYEARGFDALIDDGPLPLVVTIEREGYSTITRTLSSLLDNPRVDALLTPLEQVGCRDGVCRSASGGLEISGFPGGTGIARAYAKEYDPTLHTSRFPGSFSDSRDNLLISSGFVEVDLRDASGKHVSELSKPVKVRFQANEASYKTLKDLQANSARIEVPMYSFNEVKGQWVAEPDGVLEDADGELIPESELASIKSGGYPGPVYIAFTTKHFSTFNCDEPVAVRACVKGRLVDQDGSPVAAASVSAYGVSYTGSAGTMTTGADGRFAADLLKSETANEDSDNNGKRGEQRTARLHVYGALGAFVAPVFDVPTAQGSVGGNISRCMPAACDCEDLGDVVVEFETPRACEVTVRAKYSGRSLGAKATFDAGAAIDGATLRGDLVGDVSIPVESSVGVCGGATCYASTANSDGSATFVVPVIGDSPRLELHANLNFVEGGTVHFYTGTVTVDGCARGETALSSEVEIEADHVALGNMGDFIASLGAGPSVGDGSKLDELKDPAGCGCSTVGAAGRASALGGGLLGALGLWIRRRSRRNSGV